MLRHVKHAVEGTFFDQWMSYVRTAYGKALDGLLEVCRGGISRSRLKLTRTRFLRQAPVAQDSGVPDSVPRQQLFAPCGVLDQVGLVRQAEVFGL
jgi:hypothetical protein